ncbi:MAG TPA: hypothetical protein DCG26_00765 [Alphaproteobacteria bacterium]|nr:hypothetical protein [Alphaproteobacteria bacterium]
MKPDFAAADGADSTAISNPPASDISSTRHLAKMCPISDGVINNRLVKGPKLATNRICVI